MFFQETMPSTPYDASDSSPNASQYPEYNYLLLSDVHLGSDLVPHSRPWAKNSWLLESAEVDARLIALFHHYRCEQDPSRPYCLVLAGDFVDLVGVSISPQSCALRTQPTRDEELYGLGSAADHVVQKMRAIAERHAGVFRALADFVAGGNHVVMVRGNHDVELHWPSAQREFIYSILKHAEPNAREGVRSRIQICPWFFVVPGLVYVEHGHEFDAMCSYGDPLMPTCSHDPRRIHATPFSVLLRQVARPTRGLRAAGYQYVGMAAYVRLLLHLGMRGSLYIAGRFARASYLLLRESYAYLDTPKPGTKRRARARHALFAARHGLRRRTLDTLRMLYVRPATRSFRQVLRSLYLDRILCTLFAIASTGCAAIVAETHQFWPSALCAAFAVLFMAYALCGSGVNTAPSERMRRGAANIAALFGTRYVVMGHTHEPVFEEISNGSHYINLGSWGEDDPPDERAASDASPCSYLLLRVVDGVYQAEFMRWDTTLGPVPFATPASSESNPDDCAANHAVMSGTI